MKPKLEAAKDDQTCADQLKVMNDYERDLKLTEQVCSNLRSYNIAPAGVQITGAWLNLTLGTAAKLSADAGKELNTCAYVVKEAKKTKEALKATKPKAKP